MTCYSYKSYLTWNLFLNNYLQTCWLTLIFFPRCSPLTTSLSDLSLSILWYPSHAYTCSVVFSDIGHFFAHDLRFIPQKSYAVLIFVSTIHWMRKSPTRARRGWRKTSHLLTNCEYCDAWKLLVNDWILYLLMGAKWPANIWAIQTFVSFSNMIEGLQTALIDLSHIYKNIFLYIQTLVSPNLYALVLGLLFNGVSKVVGR